MTEDLRALLQADLRAERPPPMGDVVGAAIREGRRIRRNRRLGTFGAGVAAVSLAVGVVLVGDGVVAARPESPLPVGQLSVEETPTEPEAFSPQTVPSAAPAPTARPETRTLTLHSGTVRADGTRTKATSAAMLHLLTRLLPPGRTSHYGVARGNDLQVRLYLDDGDGPAMVAVSLRSSRVDGRAKSDELVRGDTTTVTIRYMPDNCARHTVVNAESPDGTLVQVDVPTCVAGDGPTTRSALTIDQAVRIASDPRWGITMDEGLVTLGAKQFPRVPVVST